VVIHLGSKTREGAVGLTFSLSLSLFFGSVALGCLSTFAEILYQLGNTLFIPGLVIGSYCLALSLISSYLTCCTLCGKI